MVRKIKVTLYVSSFKQIRPKSSQNAAILAEAKSVETASVSQWGQIIFHEHFTEN